VALTYEIDSRVGFIEITRSHNPTFDEWRQFMEGLLADARFTPGMSIVEDRRGVLDAPTRIEVEIAAAWIRANATRLGKSRWAIVVDPGSQAAYGMARVGEFLTERSGVAQRPFTHVDEARAWAVDPAVTE
jgi:hypothetical protein